jgi:hypothetical protein
MWVLTGEHSLGSFFGVDFFSEMDMLREQILGLAMKTLARAYETKELVVKKLQEDKTWQAYWQNAKDTAKKVVEQQLYSDIPRANPKAENKAAGFSRSRKTTTKVNVTESAPKRERKSSIRPAKEIKSAYADSILALIKNDSSRMIKKTDSLDGKKSLAYLVWALGHAERAKIKEGISVHDVSALLYQANKIELYPINISRVVHSNTSLIRQVGQDKRTKTYLLTPEGKKTFSEKLV